MSTLRFTKMHGLGNDFIVLDGVRQKVDLTAAQVARLADRHFGIGCDQLLLVEPATDPANDFRYRIFNADGCEVEQCGNGARCFVRFVHEQGLTGKTAIRVETANGVIVPQLEADGNVTVDMGAPRFEPESLPFEAPEDALRHALLVDGEVVQVAAVSMGNPHAVLQVADVDAAPVSRLGPAIEGHLRFPRRVNAGFMQVVDRQSLRLRVFERGSGETLACGTGACAAAVAAIRQGLADSPVQVAMRGGMLGIAWEGAGQPVRMTGPAITVFEGKISPSLLTNEGNP